MPLVHLPLRVPLRLKDELTRQAELEGMGRGQYARFLLRVGIEERRNRPAPSGNREAGARPNGGTTNGG
jgi:hypothetical protein